MNSKFDILKKLLPGFIPLFIFIIADEIWGTKIGLIVAVSVGVLEFAYTWIKNKRIDNFILMDILMLTVLGLISIIFDNDIFFKLKPAFIQSIFCVILAISVFSKQNLLMLMSKRYMKDMPSNKAVEDKFNQSLKILFYIFTAHTILVYYSAFYLTKEAWVFISGGLIYIIFGVYFVFEFIRTKYFAPVSEELLPIVNEKGEIIGKAPRSECHQDKNLMHPVVHLHIINSNNQIYLQKRPENKLIQPGKWDTAVGGHVAFGESIELSLERESMEEIGISGFEYQLVAKYKWESTVETELVFMFISRYDGEISINKSELADGKFWSFKEISKGIGKEIFTPNFELEFQMLSKFIKK